MALLEIAGGAAIAVGTTWLFEHRREQRADADQAAAVKAAASIAHTDLGTIARNLDRALKQRHWLSTFRLPLAGWGQQGHRLAGTLSPTDYETVAHAFDHAADLEREFGELLSGLARGIADNIPAVALVPDSELGQRVKDALEQAERSRRILGAVRDGT